MDRLWNAVVIRLRRFRTRGVDEGWFHSWVAIEISGWMAKLRGRQNGWTYSEQQQINNLLRAVFLAKANGATADTLAEELSSYWRQLHLRTFDPLPSCTLICTQQPPSCLYRQAVVESLSSTTSGQFQTAYLEEMKIGPALPKTWDYSLSVARKLLCLERAEPAIKRAALCYAQHELIKMSDEERGRIINRLLTESQRKE